MNVTMNSKLRFQLSLSVVGLAFIMLQCVAVESHSVLFHIETDIPPSFDWRTKGVVSQVKEMGQKGEVWDFAATECVESLHAIQTGKLYSLSVNELNDCCPNAGMGFQCIVKLGGMCTAQAYGAASGSCHSGSCAIVAKVTESVQVPPKREDLMVNALLKNPLMVYIDASEASFQTYTSGIYDDKDCSQIKANHALQLVGYGTRNGQDYWIARNSWGTNWGTNGYIYLSRGTNTCGLANFVSYPQ